MPLIKSPFISVPSVVYSATVPIAPLDSSTYKSSPLTAMPTRLSPGKKRRLLVIDFGWHQPNLPGLRKTARRNEAQKNDKVQLSRFRFPQGNGPSRQWRDG